MYFYLLCTYDYCYLLLCGCYCCVHILMCFPSPFPRTVDYGVKLSADRIYLIRRTKV